MYYRTTVSQLSEAGGDLWVHLLQPLLKQGLTEQSAQDHIRWLLKISVEKTTQPLGILCSTPYTAQKCF